MATANTNIINDLGIITKIPNKILNELTDKMVLCIGSAIHEAIETDEKALMLNIGIGTLSIDLVDMQCKFIPSKDLKATIKRGLGEKIDPLEIELEQTLVDKLISICQEVL